MKNKKILVTSSGQVEDKNKSENEMPRKSITSYPRQNVCAK